MSRREECMRACQGLSTEQLVAMNAIEWGSLAHAYDAASTIVEGIGFDTLEDPDALADIPSDDAFNVVSGAAESAMRACAWTREARK